MEPLSCCWRQVSRWDNTSWLPSNAPSTLAAHRVHRVHLQRTEHLALSLSLYLSVYLSIDLSKSKSKSIYPPTYLAIYVPIYLSICLSIDLSIYLSICLPICQSRPFFRIYLSSFSVLIYLIDLFFVQSESRNICQIGCPTECQNRCQIECWVKCQNICPHVCLDMPWCGTLEVK